MMSAFLEDTSTNLESDPVEENTDHQENKTKEEVAPPSPEETDKSLEKAEKTLEDELAETKEHLLRALAEAENLRKRSQKEREESAKFGITSFARDLLTVADNLDRALESLSSLKEEPKQKDKEEKVFSMDHIKERFTESPTDTAQTVKAFIEGVSLTEKELQALLSRHGVKEVRPVGEKFDHNFHEAVFEEETSDHPPGTVTQCLQVGYVIKERLLRPAMVAVAKAKS